MNALAIKPYSVTVEGFPAHRFYARSRGKALSEAWQSFSSYRDDVSFGDFLKIARCEAGEAGHGFGEPITVAGKPAFMVSYDRQYIQFVRPCSDVIMNSHPLDVLPPEARRGTPYAETPA